MAGTTNDKNLFGKLLLPGFADAGASTSFHPISSSAPPATIAEDQLSEAPTEIHDNRTSSLSDRQQKQEKEQQLLYRQKSHDEGNIKGFFPTTKPPKSPRPVSPPIVMRQQLPSSSTNSVAGSSVVPETGSYKMQSGKQEEESRQQEEEQEATTKSKYWKQEELSDGPQPLEQQVEEDDSRTTEDSGPINRDNSLLEEDDDDGVGSDVVSDVLSTASEMGTVINIGNMTAKMAEIDAMAALIEASPHFESQQQQLGAADGDEIRELNSGLSLPILESKSFDRPSFLPRNNRSSNGENSYPPDLGLRHHTSTTGTSTMATATTSAAVSAAIRRIGSGLTNATANKKNHHSSLSAPPTPKTPGVPPPPRVKDLLKSALTPQSSANHGNADHRHPPPSFALRSPGSRARMEHKQGAARATNASLLTPRFSAPSSPAFSSSHQQQPNLESFHRSMTDEHTSNNDNNLAKASNTTSTPRRDNPNNGRLAPTMSPNILGPFRLAQKCFSFDSTLDEFPEAYHDDGDRVYLHLPPRKFPSSNTTSSRTLHHSKSWDVGPSQQSFFGTLRQTAGSSHHKHAKPRRLQSLGIDSPNKTSTPARNNQSIIELQTPQRIEIEREDALDILACLVERGVAAWNNNKNESDRTGVLAEDETTLDTSSTNESLIIAMAEDFRRLSKQQDYNVPEEDEKEHHSKRMAALNELLKSHTYALEMKRATVSASSWLKSIGRCPDSQTFMNTKVEGEVTIASNPGGQTSGEEDKSETAFSDSASKKMEMLSLKAMLHSAQMELKEKTEANRKLDEELSKCREEIGRLKSASRAEQQHIVLNRSIIDDHEQEESEPTPDRVGMAMNRAEDNDPPSPIPKQGSDISDGNNRMFDESFNGNNSCLQEAQISTESERLDVMVMKRTLEQANVTIRRLHGELQKDKLEDYCEPAPVVEIPGATSLDEQQPLVDENHRTVNVRMLDGENFVTEWDDLRPPLPPPPDHGLRSPIVRAVLEQWTSDRALHDSLVSWIERVMTGDDLETVPPLTISSLDHQVRDGFTMHVLPLLLRRADIHVAVQTRAHRRTAYDMAVIVNQKSHAQHAPGDQKHSLLDQHVATDEWVQNFEPRIDSAMSVANSAVTEQITNGGTRPSHFRKQEGNDEEYTFFGSLQSASADVDDALHHQQQHQHQSTIMGALGGALGGLLSRNKFAVASPSRMQHFPPPGSNLTPEFRAQMDLTASPIPYSYSHDPHHRGGEHEEQPYHRVVSAPPGRIGVTFVEYRGHAMVSDVAPDSPLSSWVFPSDILIAIDEVPVSGMRVRDIIQVMTTRRDRQRALRVISSHAMNEFTLNANNLNDEAE